MRISFQELSEHLMSEHIGQDGKPHPVDSQHGPNAYTSRYFDRDTHAILVDIDSSLYRVDGDGVWHVPGTLLPTLGYSVATLLRNLEVLDSRQSIVAPYCVVDSMRAGHQHLYILVDLAPSQMYHLHACLTNVGVEGWGNLLWTLERGHSTLFWPGAKAQIPAAVIRNS